MIQGIYSFFQHHEEVPVIKVGDGFIQIVATQEKLALAAAWLNQHHPGRYMVWNLMHDMKREGLNIAADVSEMFSDNLQDIAAAVGPPVLEDVLKFCHSAHRWTHAEQDNVAVLLTNSKHDVEEYAAMLCCAFALYVGWQRNVLEAWISRQDKINDLQATAIDLLLNPEMLDQPSKIPLSQPCLAYLLYMEHLIYVGDIPDGVPLHIGRLVMHGIPRVGDKDGGCRPVLTVRSAKTGVLQFSSLWDMQRNKCVSEPLNQDSLSAIFVVDRPFHGDIILQLHHLNQKAAAAAREEERYEEGQGWELLVSFSFHTMMAWTHAWESTPSSAPQTRQLSNNKAGLLRLPRETLGIDAADGRFDTDFELDLVVSEFNMPPEHGGGGGGGREGGGGGGGGAKTEAGRGGGGGGGGGGLSATSSVDTVDETVLEAVRTELHQSASSQALTRLIETIPARAPTAVPPSPSRPVIRVTPNPRELLGEDQGSDVNVNSVPVRFSFPPVDDPFDPDSKTKSLVVAQPEGLSDLIPLDDTPTYGLPISGLAMVLPSLVVLEPYERDANARDIGRKRCKIRIPIENIVSCSLHSTKAASPIRRTRSEEAEAAFSPAREGAAAREEAETKSLSEAGGGSEKSVSPHAKRLSFEPKAGGGGGGSEEGEKRGDGGEGGTVVKGGKLEGNGNEAADTQAIPQSEVGSNIPVTGSPSVVTDELEHVAQRVREGGNLSREAAVVLRVEWDCGDAVGLRRVVVGDGGQTQHVRGLSEKINDNRAVLEERIKQAIHGNDEAGRAWVEEECPIQLVPPPAADVALDLAMANALRRHLPYRVFACATWELLYGTAHHGISLSTFFNRTGWRAPTLVVVKDTNYEVFGAFCSAPWEAHTSYFGTGESFVWKWDSEKEKVKVFRWSQENTMFQLARIRDGIAVGGGSNNAVRLDPDFLNGSSGPSETFMSPQLSSSPHFKCLFCEVWGFTE